MSFQVKVSNRVFTEAERKKARSSVHTTGNKGIFRCQLTNHPWLSFTFPDYPRRIAAAKAAEMLAAEGLTYRFEQVG